jgi:hypothetical protein
MLNNAGNNKCLSALADVFKRNSVFLAKKLLERGRSLNGTNNV